VRLRSSTVEQLVERLDDQEYGERARYRLLETIRQYGREKRPGSGEQTAVRARPRDHYQELAKQAETDVFGPRHGEWLGRLLIEHGNLRTALEFLPERAWPGKSRAEFSGRCGPAHRCRA
jgi:non-specific serine/threonine protein kinase